MWGLGPDQGSNPSTPHSVLATGPAGSPKNLDFFSWQYHVLCRSQFLTRVVENLRTTPAKTLSLRTTPVKTLSANHWTAREVPRIPSPYCQSPLLLQGPTKILYMGRHFPDIFKQKLYNLPFSTTKISPLLYWIFLQMKSLL